MYRLIITKRDLYGEICPRLSHVDVRLPTHFGTKRYPEYVVWFPGLDSTDRLVRISKPYGNRKQLLHY